MVFCKKIELEVNNLEVFLMRSSHLNPELSEAKENPGIYRKFRESTAVPPKMFEDDTYQVLGRQIQRYFEETKQNHLGRVTKILTPKEGD